eukprot:TRINITY_DN76338_c0_g1_i1.p1 TRINITY_DN76338_c0_g1~~TRINITY_DN76338_c0_g1_i1.p1  ORF type:complete len:580 (+),score=85.28 TRINITY_DN76338_c0_g1_i1:166-1905(+)
MVAPCVSSGRVMTVSTGIFLAVAASIPEPNNAADLRRKETAFFNDALCLAERNARLLLRNRRRLTDEPVHLERGSVRALPLYDPEAMPASRFVNSAFEAAFSSDIGMVTTVPAEILPPTSIMPGVSVASKAGAPAPAPPLHSLLNITTTTLPAIARTSIPPAQRVGAHWQEYVNEMTSGRQSVNATDIFDMSDVVLPVAVPDTSADDEMSISTTPSVTIVPANLPEHEVKTVNFAITVMNVDYSLLATQKQSLQKYNAILKEAILNACGGLVETSDVEIAYFEGSVVCQVWITNPRTVSADVLQSTLNSNVGSIPSRIADDFDAVPEFSLLTTGSINVQISNVVLQVPDNNYADSFRDCVVGDWTSWGSCHKDTAEGYKHYVEERYRPIVRPHLLGGLPCLPQVMRRPCPFGGWSSATAKETYAYSPGGSEDASEGQAHAAYAGSSIPATVATTTSGASIVGEGVAGPGSNGSVASNFGAVGLYGGNTYGFVANGIAGVDDNGALPGTVGSDPSCVCGTVGGTPLIALQRSESLSASRLFGRYRRQISLEERGETAASKAQAASESLAGCRRICWCAGT